MPVSTTNLVLDLRAGVGLTLDGSNRVSQWNDQSAAGNNCIQATAGSRPYDYTDYWGDKAVMFPYDYPTHPANFLDVPMSMSGINTRAFTVIMVVAPFHLRSSCFYAINGFGANYLGISAGSSSPPKLNIATRISTGVYAPCNKAVFACVGRSAESIVQWNNLRETLLSVGSATGLSGGIIGARAGANGLSGLIYRVLVWNRALSNAEVDAEVALLYSEHDIFTDYTRQIICRGDSITDGIDSTELRSYPFQLWELRPEWKIYHFGEAGIKIGTVGAASTMADLDDTLVDPLFDGTLTENVLKLLGGTNDISSDGLTGAQCFTRLIDYMTARKAAHSWTTWVGTLPDRSTLDTQVADYNTLIRGGHASVDEAIDYGKNSPTETRLNDSTNATYYSDGVHLTNAGCLVIAEHLAPFMEAGGGGGGVIMQGRLGLGIGRLGIG